MDGVRCKRTAQDTVEGARRFCVVMPGKMHSHLSICNNPCISHKELILLVLKKVGFLVLVDALVIEVGNVRRNSKNVQKLFILF